ncbi:MAG: hypothetical protein WDO24_06960 [Pseudomonadota bacterium]
MPIDTAKAVADALGIPLYIHIGELQETLGVASPAEDAFRIAQAGDIVTHIYHNYLGRILDDQGKLLPVVRDAERRGVLFDLGFGNYGFSWDVAEKAYAQGLVPHFISSDLQQFNVLGPVCSLANVMSVCLRLGLSLSEGLAFINSVGTLGGFAGPYMMGWLKDATGTFVAGLVVMAVVMLATTALSASLRRVMTQE